MEPASSVMLSADVLVAITARRGRKTVDVRQQRQLEIDPLRRGFDDEVRLVPARPRESRWCDSRPQHRVGVAGAHLAELDALADDRLDRRAPFIERGFGDTSNSRVSYPPAIAACAIPCPIVPAPSTAIRRIVISETCQRAAVTTISLSTPMACSISSAVL